MADLCCNCIIQVDRLRLGRDLRTHLKAVNVSHEEFCEEVGMSRGTLNRLFTGRIRYVEPILTAISFMGRKADDYTITVAESRRG